MVGKSIEPMPTIVDNYKVSQVIPTSWNKESTEFTDDIQVNNLCQSEITDINPVHHYVEPEGKVEHRFKYRS